MFFYKQNNVPVQSVLNIYTRHDAIQFPTGNMDLGFCGSCEFISNYAFQLELLKYGTGYEATQNYSMTFNTFAVKQAQELIDRYQLRDKTLMEIGCGNGEFLSLLCELGDNRGIGFDPAYVEGRVPSSAIDRLTFIKDCYSTKYTNYSADFLYCKMTLEHIPDVGSFISTVRQTLGDRMDTIVFFQVPDVTRILTQIAFEDIYYEHCSYFNQSSLTHLFSMNRFEVLTTESLYNGQYITVAARPAGEASNCDFPEGTKPRRTRNLAKEFSGKMSQKIWRWQQRLSAYKSEGAKLVLWGSGSKAVSFLTTLDVDDEIGYVVDINPHRHGTYLAKSGHPIIAPEFLRDYKPDVVIVMNEIYKNEIQSDLLNRNLSPRLITLSRI